MKKLLTFLLMTVLLLCTFVGCSKTVITTSAESENKTTTDTETETSTESDTVTSTETDTETSSETETEPKETYKKISAEEAKEIMERENNAVILDVRSQREYDERHIDGALLIPSGEIKLKAEEILQDKDQHIIVYCKSGNRSKAAAKELIALGYKNVYDMGSIDNWKNDTTKAN